jgi:hypothetical protein
MVFLKRCGRSLDESPARIVADPILSRLYVLGRCSIVAVGVGLVEGCK